MCEPDHTVEAVRSFLNSLGINPTSPNFIDTPTRVAKMWREFTRPQTVNLKSFPIETKTGLIVYKGHQSWGFCPHHLLPVLYTFKVGYLPKKRQVIGASKIPRLINQVLSKLPLQEEIPGLVGLTLVNALDPRAVGTIIEGEHQCTRIRGVRSACLSMIGTFMWGELLEEGPTREEFMLL